MKKCLLFLTTLESYESVTSLETLTTNSTLEFLKTKQVYHFLYVLNFIEEDKLVGLEDNLREKEVSDIEQIMQKKKKNMIS